MIDNENKMEIVRETHTHTTKTPKLCYIPLHTFDVYYGENRRKAKRNGEQGESIYVTKVQLKCANYTT